MSDCNVEVFGNEDGLELSEIMIDYFVYVYIYICTTIKGVC